MAVDFAWRRERGSNTFGAWDEVLVALDEQDLQLGKSISIPVDQLPAFIRLLIGVQDEIAERDA